VASVPANEFATQYGRRPRVQRISRGLFPSAAASEFETHVFRVQRSAGGFLPAAADKFAAQYGLGFRSARRVPLQQLYGNGTRVGAPGLVRQNTLQKTAPEAANAKKPFSMPSLNPFRKVDGK
jgi:hypothetical protein